MTHNRIRELRKKSKISQEKLAEELGVTQASVSLYETGAAVPSDMLIKISAYFGVTVDYLLNITDTRSETEQSLLSLWNRIPEKYRALLGELVRLIECDTRYK